MNLNRCSELTLVLAVALLTATAGVAGAVSVASESVPQEPQQAGQSVTLEVTLGSLYENQSSWELSGETKLEDAQWTVEASSDGQATGSASYSGATFDAGKMDQSSENAPDEVRVEVTGTVPAPESYSYADGQTFEALAIEGATDDVVFTVDAWSLEHFTNDSRAARSRLEAVESSIDQARSDGEDISDARATWEEAVTAFDSGDFQTATARADEASSQVEASAGGSGSGSANDSDGTNSTDGDGADGDASGSGNDTDGSAAGATGSSGGGDGVGFLTVLTYVLGLAVVVGIVGGGIYLNRQRQGPGRDPLG